MVSLEIKSEIVSHMGCLGLNYARFLEMPLELRIVSITDVNFVIMANPGCDLCRR